MHSSASLQRVASEPEPSCTRNETAKVGVWEERGGGVYKTSPGTAVGSFWWRGSTVLR